MSDADELRKLLNEWNPIGGESPPDEYDDLIRPITRKLESGCNPEFLEKFLIEFLRVNYGLNTTNKGVGEFANRVHVWYQKDRKQGR